MSDNDNFQKFFLRDLGSLFVCVFVCLFFFFWGGGYFFIHVISTCHLRYVGCILSSVPPPLIMLNIHALNKKNILTSFNLHLWKNTVEQNRV